MVACDRIDGLHYLDDFLLFGKPDSPQCELSLQWALARCRVLGVPVAPNKTEGPTTKLVFFRSERKPAFKWTLWCVNRTDFDSSIILLKKDRPGLTTQQACCN